MCLSASSMHICCCSHTLAETLTVRQTTNVSAPLNACVIALLKNLQAGSATSECTINAIFKFINHPAAKSTLSKWIIFSMQPLSANINQRFNNESLVMSACLDSLVTQLWKVLFALSLFPFPQQTGPLSRGGWVKATRSTSTGEAQHPGSRSAPAGWSGTAPTPNTTATATQTKVSGECCPQERYSNTVELLWLLQTNRN